MASIGGWEELGADTGKVLEEEMVWAAQQSAHFCPAYTWQRSSELEVGKGEKEKRIKRGEQENET